MNKRKSRRVPHQRVTLGVFRTWQGTVEFCKNPKLSREKRNTLRQQGKYVSLFMGRILPGQGDRHQDDYRVVFPATAQMDHIIQSMIGRSQTVQVECTLKAHQGANIVVAFEANPGPARPQCLPSDLPQPLPPSPHPQPPLIDDLQSFTPPAVDHRRWGQLPAS